MWSGVRECKYVVKSRPLYLHGSYLHTLSSLERLNRQIREVNYMQDESKKKRMYCWFQFCVKVHVNSMYLRHRPKTIPKKKYAVHGYQGAEQNTITCA